MVQIAGKYQNVENSNFLTFMKQSGYSEERAAAADKLRPIITFAVNGDKLEVKLEGVGGVVENTFIFGKETDEKHVSGITSKTVATLEGNVLKFLSNGEDGKSFSRILTFSDKGFEEVLFFGDVKAKRIYKKL